MNFKQHSNLEGQHAFLGASKYHWVNYDLDKLTLAYKKHLATERGTRLHEFAKECILLGQRLPKSNKTLNLYVNDAIGYKMTPEQVLYYSDNCFGTVDSISFRNKFLRIHDYKSGDTPASMKQLEVYTALFCLEYNIDPESIKIELRLYQKDAVLVHEPEASEIIRIMNKIIEFDKHIEKIKGE